MSTPVIRAAPAAKPPVARPGPTEAELRAHLSKFLTPDADLLALASVLKPTRADCDAIFDKATATTLGRMYDQLWVDASPEFEPGPGATRLELSKATSEELAAGTGNARRFSRGWQQAGKHLAPYRVWYRFVFTKPGEHDGWSYEGVTLVNGHWVIALQPWRGMFDP